MSKKPSARLRHSLVALLIAPAALLSACGEEVINNYYSYGDGGADTGEGAAPGAAGTADLGGNPAGGEAPGSEGGSAGQAAETAGAGGEPTPVDADPLYPDAPRADTPVAE